MSKNNEYCQCIICDLAISKSAVEELKEFAGYNKAVKDIKLRFDIFMADKPYKEEAYKALFKE